MKKKIEGYLIVNWKTKEIKVTKRKPIGSRITPYQIPIKLELDIIIPEKKEMVAKGEIEVTETKANQIILECI